VIATLTTLLLPSLMLTSYAAVLRGNTRLFEEVRKVVLRAYPDLAPEALPMHMLEWAQMIERDRQLGLGTGMK
jgi:hypothetical protein